MRHSRLWVATAIIALFIVIGFVLSVPHTRDVGKTSVSEGATTSTPSVSLHDSFKKGLHTITGSFEAPNACTSVTAQATFSNEASSTGTILVALSSPEDSGICLQVPTQVKFLATVSAPARVPITVTVNGAAATTRDL